MKRQEVSQKLQQVFCEVFDDENIALDDDTSSDDIEDWDSFEQINLIVAIEKAFDMKFSIQEAGHLQNVGDIVNLILQKMNQ